MSDKYHVLVNDDEADIREVICKVLEDIELNIKTYQAKDGVEGLTKVKNQKFDLVITDPRVIRGQGHHVQHSVSNASVLGVFLKQNMEHLLLNVLLLIELIN